MTMTARRALVAVTVVLVPLGVALTIAAADRDPDIGDGWKSRVLLTAIGGAAALLYAIVGALIARAEPRNAIGWIFLAAAALLGVVITTFAYVDLALTGEGSLPGAIWAEWVGQWCFIPAVFVPPAIVAQIFPDGRPLPGRWRWVLWGSVAVAASSVLASALDPSTMEAFSARDNPAGIPDAVAGPASWYSDASGALLAPLVFLLSLTSLVVRFRRSRGIERQQMKWLAWAGAVPVTAFAISFIESTFVDEGAIVDVVFITGFAGLMLVPVAVAIAILRYRLYEIDRVISRTLVYGLVTVVLGAAYVALVLAGQAVFSSFAGGSNLAIAASTLIVAALFLPLRGRVQRLVDRRFYRRRYDAQQTLAAFGTRLREQVDLDGLCRDLEALVTETMQPAHVTLWLREAPA
jgi:hypothetical protein